MYSHWYKTVSLLFPPVSPLLVLWESRPCWEGERKVRSFSFLTLQEIAFSNAFDEIWSLSHFAEIWKLLCNYQQSEFYRVIFPFPNKAGINFKILLLLGRKNLFPLFLFSVVFFYSDLKSLLLSLYFWIIAPTVVDIPKLHIIYLKVHDIIHLNIFFSGQTATAQVISELTWLQDSLIPQSIFWQHLSWNVDFTL